MTLFFPRIQETSPFFQLLSEIDSSSRPARCQPRHHRRQQRSFTPSFDVKETEASYQLYGELPGIAQSDINIEWADDKTISVSGRSERRYQSTDAEPAAAPAVDAEKALADEASSAAEEGYEEITKDQASYQKPSVEDEAGEGEASSPATAVPEQAVEKQSEAPAAQQQQPKYKYWISERSTGSFQRTFQFPARVEHDQVSASLRDGILSVTIPKAKPLEPRKITVN